MKIQRILGSVVCGLTLTIVCALPAAAASGHIPSTPAAWEKHDTAVYVVSTLNVLRTRRGQPLVALLQQKQHVTQFDVWEDEQIEGLYFVQLKRSDGSLAGALAYQMGWAKPQYVSKPLGRTGALVAPAQVVRAFKSDPKNLMGSFTSTFPR